MLVTPVTLPPGRARLATRPDLTGSATLTKTIGIVDVARLAAATAGVPHATMTSTLNRTSSVATASDGCSAHRYSMSRF